MKAPDTRPNQAVEIAKRMYCAVLTPWASDMIDLRSRGLDRPSRRSATGLAPIGPRLGLASRPIRFAQQSPMRPPTSHAA